MSDSHRTFAADAALGGGLRRRVESELVGNILPFWIAYAPDEAQGGFHGAVTNDLRPLDDVPRSAVLCARILWSFSASARALGGAEAYLAMARRARDELAHVFWDPAHGGVYWLVDAQRRPVNDRKHTYAQAFAIYGLTEHYLATSDGESLRLARALFELLEAHAHDAADGGYVEGCGTDWGALDDMRLSEKEPACRKSMNTLLHVMEAYTNLVRAWDDERPRARLRELITVFLERVIDPRTSHFRLFFDDHWGVLGEGISYGHDIEGSWLLVEAAEQLGDRELLARARAVALEMARAVYAEALDAEGRLRAGDDAHDEGGRQEWWGHAEAVVGFYNAFQVGGDPRFADAALRCWDYIEAHFVDRRHGDWFKVLSREGMPDLDHPKIGPWECPYHHSRVCLEMLRRLADGEERLHGRAS